MDNETSAAQADTSGYDWAEQARQNAKYSALSQAIAYTSVYPVPSAVEVVQIAETFEAFLTKP